MTVIEGIIIKVEDDLELIPPIIKIDEITYKTSK